MTLHVEQTMEELQPFGLPASFKPMTESFLTHADVSPEISFDTKRWLGKNLYRNAYKK